MYTVGTMFCNLNITNIYLSLIKYILNSDEDIPWDCQFPWMTTEKFA